MQLQELAEIKNAPADRNGRTDPVRDRVKLFKSLDEKYIDKSCSQS